MTTRTRKSRRFGAVVGAFALALGGALATNSVAHAQPAPGQDGAPAPGQYGAPTEATLTIQKFVDNGQKDQPLEGVKFSVTQVGKLDSSNTCVAIDLTDSAQWKGLDNLFASPNGAAPTGSAEGDFCLTATVHEFTTGVDGKASKTLPLGIYHAVETDIGPNPVVSKAYPFYISLPTTKDTANGTLTSGWNYDVQAFPKNKVAEKPMKTIADQGDGARVIGSEVAWTITSPIPTLSANEKFTQAEVTDNFDSRLVYSSSTLKIVKQGAADVELIEGTHYDVDNSNGTKWTFKDAGYQALTDNQGGNLVVEVKTKVSDPIGDGAIANRDYKSQFNNALPQGGEPTPYTYWGQLELLKVDNSATQKKLKGAEFEVYNSDSAGQCPAAKPTTGVLANGTSNEHGVVVWDNSSQTLGLWIANSDNGAINPLPTRNYCVYETKAPAGHVGQNEPWTSTISPGETAKNTITAVNKRKDGPDLPLTGAQGTIALTVAGLGLLGAGAGALSYARRRR